MLMQFNFKNFKSFRDDSSLDMTATSITEHPYNLIDGDDGEKYIKVAAIYGANASGKSSVIQAFKFMRKWVNKSFKEASESEAIPFKRFAFDENYDEPAEFEVFFSALGLEYQYGFSLDNTKIIEEWLYVKLPGKKKYNTLFERSYQDITCNDELMPGAKNFISMLEEKTLFLSILSNTKTEHAKFVNVWFGCQWIIDFGDIEFEDILLKLVAEDIKDKEFTKELITFLNGIDINIDDIIVEETNNEYEKYKVYTKHLINGTDKYYTMPLSEESSGTQKMFSLFYFIKNSLENGHSLFIDELDAKLHPLLLRYILTMFHDENINKMGAQLIYTTHDNYTLTKEIFRRDQIWFVEKDSDAVSHLYSLAEYKTEDDKKVRKDASYNKDYLLGKYGSVPILRGYDMWGNNHDGKTE